MGTRSFVGGRETMTDWVQPLNLVICRLMVATLRGLFEGTRMLC